MQAKDQNNKDKMLKKNTKNTLINTVNKDNKLNKDNKGLILAGTAATLLASGFIATPIATAAPTMVKCITKTRGCGNGCGKSQSTITTLRECQEMGGTPVRIDEESDASDSKINPNDQEKES